MFILDECYCKGRTAGEFIVKSKIPGQPEPGYNARGAALEIRQQRKLHEVGCGSGKRKTIEKLRKKWAQTQLPLTGGTLPKATSFPKYYQTAYAVHGDGITEGRSTPAETPVSLLGAPSGKNEWGLHDGLRPSCQSQKTDIRMPKAREFKLAFDPEDVPVVNGFYKTTTEKATYADLGCYFDNKTPAYGNPVKHHSMSAPVFPDVQDVTRWRPGVGPPTNPDPALEAKCFSSTYMDHGVINNKGDPFKSREKGQASKHHYHTNVGEKCTDADHIHGKKDKWHVLTWRPGVGDPVNPDPAKEARMFSSTYADLGPECSSPYCPPAVRMDWNKNKTKTH